MPRRHSLALWPFVLALVSVGCSTTVTVRYVPRPAPGPTRRVAVVSKRSERFARGQNKLEARLIDRLSRSGRFVVLERKEIDAVLRESSFSLRAVVDERTAVSAGKLLAADAIVLLSLTSEQLGVQRHEVSEYIDGHASAAVKLIDVRTGRILAAASREAYVSVIERYSTFAEARHLLLDKLADRLAAALQPEAAARTLDLEKTANGEVREGVRFAQSGLWEEAAAAWAERLKRAPDDAAAHYNLAMAQRVLGDSEEELKHLRAAVRLRPSKRLYLRALAEAK